MTLGRRLLLLLLTAAAASCSSRREVVVYTSVDQVFSAPIFRAFEREQQIRVRAVYDTEETKSTGVVNRLIAEARRPQADVFWSNDPVRPFLLVRRGLVQPYRSPQAAAVPPAFKAADGTWTGFAARARVLLVNRNRVPRDQTPRSVRDLAEPRWQGQTAIANPLYGTTTMHVAALFLAWGDAGGRDFMARLKANGVRIASSNGEVKRLVAAGEVAFGVADTDDGFEAIHDGAPIEVVYPDQDGLGTLVMPTTAVLLRGAPHAAAGQRLIDHLLTVEVERRMAESAHVPVRPGIATPAGVKPLGQFRPMPVDYARVADEMQRLQPWLRQWVGL